MKLFLMHTQHWLNDDNEPQQEVSPVGVFQDLDEVHQYIERWAKNIMADDTRNCHWYWEVKYQLAEVRETGTGELVAEFRVWWLNDVGRICY